MLRRNGGAVQRLADMQKQKKSCRNMPVAQEAVCSSGPTCRNGHHTLAGEGAAHLLHLRHTTGRSPAAGCHQQLLAIPGAPCNLCRCTTMCRSQPAAGDAGAITPPHRHTCSAGSALRQVSTSPVVVSADECAAPAQMAAATGRATSLWPRWKEMGAPPMDAASRTPCTAPRVGGRQMVSLTAKIAASIAVRLLRAVRQACAHSHHPASPQLSPRAGRGGG